ncbi:MAG: AAA family ATPase [Candidatus Thermoplasmatota archaeon]|nr:AAA family ATPase [Candidatus Thermoplasmatota archaeon]
MGIKRMQITNFKSFNQLELTLDKFNVLIGANAGGKSNFVQIFQFIRDISEYGLDNAISMQGGIEYLRNIKIGASKNLSFTVASDTDYRGICFDDKGLIGIKTYEIIYDFEMGFKKRGHGFDLVKDKLTMKCKFYKLKQKRVKVEEKETIGEGEIILSHNKKTVSVELNSTNESIKSIKTNEFLSRFFKEQKLNAKVPLIEKPHIIPMNLFGIVNLFDNISIYDFDPKLSKQPSRMTGKSELEESGKNLSIILKNILKDKEKKRKFVNLLKDILPFIDDFDVDRFVDKSLLVTLQETYYQDTNLPASLISDGTVNILALIVALYFEIKPLTIIEEPERNIHPYLISKIIAMMKDASNNKQILITTHNPEIVKNAGLENLLLTSRDKDGFSKIEKPGDKESVKAFLKNQIGIDELYIQNLLGA